MLKCSKCIVAKYVVDTPLQMSKLIREKGCTANNIIDMAYQGKIKAIGKYSCFAPSVNISPLIIDADIPIITETFLNGRKLVKGKVDLATVSENASCIKDIPVSLMSDSIRKRKLILFIDSIGDPNDQTVLAWYQGNLNFYRRTPTLPTANWWHLLTFIGLEICNAPLIARFLVKNFPEIEGFTRKMK
ncbi:unnamed protein product [Blumeria hordei]|uniref:Uncharacterized protein n=1 Tax=Blumeria hordei TaxID=2867405 RepID=A0A383UWW0_BLUHO|nr:unnamed protein product [Blumeria hordei]